MAINKFLLVGALAVFVLAVSVWAGTRPHAPLQLIPVTPAPTSGQPMLQTQKLTIGTTHVLAEVASTSQEQVDGLSGRTSLQEGTGMLFVFPAAIEIGFWMKDMQFSIDMIFADESGTIVTIAANASPDSYPQTFSPTKPAKYVLEVPAGFAAAHSIAVGQQIVLQ